MQERPKVPTWHHDAVIYQIHVKAFRDSNRDGYGDFRGLLEKLDYIAERRVRSTACVSGRFSQFVPSRSTR